MVLLAWNVKIQSGKSSGTVYRLEFKEIVVGVDITTQRFSRMPFSGFVTYAGTSCLTWVV